MRLSIVCLTLCLISACSSFSELGVLQRRELLAEYPAFAPTTASSDPHLSSLNAQLEKSADKPHIVVYLGLWCHDSEIQLPQLLAVFDHLPVQSFSYELYGLNRLKRDPANRAVAHRIFRTPTVVVERNNQEVGRIVERPSVSWAADLAKIINQEPHHSL